MGQTLSSIVVSLRGTKRSCVGAVHRHQLGSQPPPPLRTLISISKVTGTGILPPKAPDTDLLTKVAGRSIAVFLAAALEHLAIGKAFGRHHGYVIDQDQELNFIGLVNLFGSFFSCMPITGGFSRTAVNSESGVKSPLSGLATTACVLVSIYKLSDAFYWIPSATLSAVIVAAVWQIVLPARVFWAYWKVSFADFFGSMVTFWITLFVSVEIGIACGVGYSLVIFRCIWLLPKLCWWITTILVNCILRLNLRRSKNSRDCQMIRCSSCSKTQSSTPTRRASHARYAIIYIPTQRGSTNNPPPLTTTQTILPLARDYGTTPEHATSPVSAAKPPSTNPHLPLTIGY